MSHINDELVILSPTSTGCPVFKQSIFAFVYFTSVSLALVLFVSNVRVMGDIWVTVPKWRSNCLLVLLFSCLPTQSHSQYTLSMLELSQSQFIASMTVSSSILSIPFTRGLLVSFATPCFFLPFLQLSEHLSVAVHCWLAIRCISKSCQNWLSATVELHRL